LLIIYGKYIVQNIWNNLLERLNNLEFIEYIITNIVFYVS